MKVGDLIKVIFSKPLNELLELIAKTRKGSDINWSEGQELENIRAIENAPLGTTEEKQRKLIFGKIAEKHSNGKLVDIVNILESMGSGSVNEFPARMDVLVDPESDEPELIAAGIKGGKAAGVLLSCYVNDNVFRLDQENLDVAELGAKL